MRDEVQHQWGFEWFVGVAERETWGRFYQIACRARRGGFGAERVGSGCGSSTEVWWVKCGKSRGYGEFERAAECWAESANCDRVVTVGHSSREKVPCIKHLRICLPLSTGRRKKLLGFGVGQFVGTEG